MQKIYRLTQRGSFAYAYRKGASVATSRLVVYKVPARNLKVGVAVGKNVGNSVVRSRVKRRINERFRLLIPLVSKGYNFVIVARAACAEATSEEINGDLVYALKKHGVYAAGAGV
jgi:ribonuclease P protein component